MASSEILGGVILASDRGETVAPGELSRDIEKCLSLSPASTLAVRDLGEFNNHGLSTLEQSQVRNPKSPTTSPLGAPILPASHGLAHSQWRREPGDAVRSTHSTVRNALRSISTINTRTMSFTTS